MAKKKATTKQKGFELTLEHSKILKSIVETLSSIIDETEIIITPKEFTIRAMDPSRICILQIVMKKKDWDEYKCSGEQKLGINLDDLHKIMNRASAKDSITLSFVPEEQKLKIKMKMITEDDKQTHTRTFQLTSLDLQIENVSLDNLFETDYTTRFAIDLLIVEEALKDAEIYSEIINVEVLKDNQLNFSSIGQIGEMLYELNAEELTELEVSEDAIGSYSVKFLKSIIKLKSITEKLVISLKTGFPARLEFDIIEGGKADFFLAPRIVEGELTEEVLADIEESEPEEKPIVEEI